MKFKKNQIVYFYEQTGEYEGRIRTGFITEAVKDLLSKTIIYTVRVDKGDVYSYFHDSEYHLTEDSLYSSKKKIEKEWKDEIVYGNLSSELHKMERLLLEVLNEVKPKLDKNNQLTLTLSSKEFLTNTVRIDAENVEVKGIGNLQEEITKIKKEIKNIKRKIKPQTKKPVVKEKKK